MTQATGEIYMIQNLVNGKRYIGKTEVGTEERWRGHIKDSRRSYKNRCHLENAVRKYGP